MKQHIYRPILLYIRRWKDTDIRIYQYKEVEGCVCVFCMYNEVQTLSGRITTIFRISSQHCYKIFFSQHQKLPAHRYVSPSESQMPIGNGPNPRGIVTATASSASLYLISFRMIHWTRSNWNWKYFSIAFHLAVKWFSSGCTGSDTGKRNDRSGARNISSSRSNRQVIKVNLKISPFEMDTL